MKKQYALIQIGYAAFSVEFSKNDAITAALEWTDYNSESEIIADLEASDGDDGDLAIIDSDHPQFASYMEIGRYIMRDGIWVETYHII